MISDTISDAIEQIKRDVIHYHGTYTYEMREAIIDMLHHMTEVRIALDSALPDRDKAASEGNTWKEVKAVVVKTIPRGMP